MNEARPFSVRVGRIPAEKALQVEEVSASLRNKLWSLLDHYFWSSATRTSSVYPGYYLSSTSNADLLYLCRQLWFHYFSFPIDELANDWRKVLKQLRAYYMGCEWNEVYDFIEFVSRNFNDERRVAAFRSEANGTLEIESSGYRFIGEEVGPVVDRGEIEEIEAAGSSGVKAIEEHLSTSLRYLSDRKRPSYRNSIKESISAVESWARLMTGKPKLSFKDALTEIEAGGFEIHGALRQAFLKLYGYTSDEGGIRHSLVDNDRAGEPEARFMLIACSAFLNLAKANGAWPRPSAEKQEPGNRE